MPNVTPLNQKGEGRTGLTTAKTGPHRNVPTAKCTTQPSPGGQNMIPLATRTGSGAGRTPRIKLPRKRVAETTAAATKHCDDALADVDHGASTWAVHRGSTAEGPGCFPSHTRFTLDIRQQGDVDGRPLSCSCTIRTGGP